MNPHSEFLILSRGQWNPESSREDIQSAIDRFYAWYESQLAAGRFKPGSRLTTEAALVSSSGIRMDGPFSESKEIIGGYWIIVAGDLEEAARLASQNPCIQHGLTFEIRPLEAARASVYNVTNETPQV